MRNTVGILGVPIDKLNMEEALERMEYFIATGRFHQVATANTNFLVNALFDPELRHILRVADMVVPDGMLVVRAAGVLRSHLEERVTGADIVPRLARIAALKGYRIFMLGGKPENAQRARERLLETYPGLNIVGCLSPQLKSILDTEINEAILAEIEAAKPHILLVAFGNPKQEKWIYLHRNRLAHVPVCIGVGGTFDFISGAVPRAPAWMQEIGLEFFWRFMHDPIRLGKRYAHDFWHFLPGLLQQYRAMRVRPSTDPSEVIATPVVEGSVILTIRGHFDSALSEQFATLAEQAIRAEKHLILEFCPGTTFDVHALGKLFNLPKRAAFKQCRVYLVTPPADVHRLLQKSRLDADLFRAFRMVSSITEALRSDNEDKPWEIDCQHERAVVTLREHTGLSHSTLVRMTAACLNLLQHGASIDLDVRSIAHIDSFLLLTLRQLQEAARQAESAEGTEHPRLRVAPGEALQHRLIQENLIQELVLIPGEQLGRHNGMTDVAPLPDANAENNAEVTAPASEKKDAGPVVLY